LQEAVAGPEGGEMGVDVSLNFKPRDLAQSF